MTISSYCRALSGVIMTVALLALASPSMAQAPAAKDSNPPAPFTAISPIFEQLVSFSMPANFIVAFEESKDGRYTREAVLKGETVQRWSQMITVTGAKGLASKPNVTPENFAGTIASGFKRACPDSFAAKALGATRIGELDAFVAVVGCGRLGSGADAYSETALLIAIKGSADVYSLQWAERTSASDKADVEHAKWQERQKRLAPIRICQRVAGEGPPYPSCVGKGT